MSRQKKKTRTHRSNIFGEALEFKKRPMSRNQIVADEYQARVEGLVIYIMLTPCVR